MSKCSRYGNLLIQKIFNIISLSLSVSVSVSVSPQKRLNVVPLTLQGQVFCNCNIILHYDIVFFADGEGDICPKLSVYSDIYWNKSRCESRHTCWCTDGMKSSLIYVLCESRPVPTWSTSSGLAGRKSERQCCFSMFLQTQAAIACPLCPPLIGNSCRKTIGGSVSVHPSQLDPLCSLYLLSSSASSSLYFCLSKALFFVFMGL